MLLNPVDPELLQGASMKMQYARAMAAALRGQPKKNDAQAAPKNEPPAEYGTPEKDNSTPEKSEAP